MVLEDGGRQHAQSNTRRKLRWLILCVQHKRHALKDPERQVLLCVQVGAEYETNAHRISTQRRHVDRRQKRIPDLQSIRLHRNDLYDRHLGAQLLRPASGEAVLLQVPSERLRDAVHARTRRQERLGDCCLVRELRAGGVERRLIKRPVLSTARCLHKGR